MFGLGKYGQGAVLLAAHVWDTESWAENDPELEVGRDLAEPLVVYEFEPASWT